MNERAIPLTGASGEPLVPEDDAFEPQPGSVVLVSGLYGTAFQRLFSDGLWHSVTGSKGRTWAWLLGQRNLVLIYDAEQRTEPNGRRARFIPIGA